MLVWVYRDDVQETKVGRYDMHVAPVPGDELVVAGDQYKIVRRRLTLWREETGIEVWVEQL